MTRRVLFNGIKYVTASNRRYVVFGHRADTGEPYIVRRSDNIETAKKIRSNARFGVIVDFDTKRVYGHVTDFKWEAAA